MVCVAAPDKRSLASSGSALCYRRAFRVGDAGWIQNYVSDNRLVDLFDIIADSQSDCGPWWRHVSTGRSVLGDVLALGRLLLRGFRLEPQCYEESSKLSIMGHGRIRRADCIRLLVYFHTEIRARMVERGKRHLLRAKHRLLRNIDRPISSGIPMADANDDLRSSLDRSPRSFAASVAVMDGALPQCRHTWLLDATFRDLADSGSRFISTYRDRFNAIFFAVVFVGSFGGILGQENAGEVGNLL